MGGNPMPCDLTCLQCYAAFWRAGRGNSIPSQAKGRAGPSTMRQQQFSQGVGCAARCWHWHGAARSSADAALATASPRLMVVGKKGIRSEE
jgi:hypothetical protein